ncbi:MAG: beta-lactamase family protein [Bacteroidetes bacterium]|nr:beta-lactamase family protein [Bacteroidota bacterium]
MNFFSAINLTHQIIIFLLLVNTLPAGAQIDFQLTGNHQIEKKYSRSFAKIDSALASYNKTNPATYSLLIIRDGKLIFEKYYNGFSIDKLNDLKSVTKSITSILIGIVLDKGLIKDENQKLFDLAPEYFNQTVDKRKREITLKQILTMSTGFDWNNFGGKWRNGWDKSKEPNKFLIQNVPLKNEPGKVWNYNSALSHLLSGLIRKYSGMSTREFAKQYLFDPLGIKNYRWQKAADGNEMGNSELFMSSRDLAKIGQLFLQNGFWNGKQIVSENWIHKSTQKYFDGFPQIGGYGYQWHTRNFGKFNSYLAAGYGGQFLIIIPDLQLVIVNTSKWNVKKSVYIIFDLTEKFLIPAFN